MTIIEEREDELSFLVKYIIPKENIKKILNDKSMQLRFEIDLMIESTDENVDLIFNKLKDQKLEITSMKTNIEKLIANKIDEIVKEILFEQF